MHFLPKPTKKCRLFILTCLFLCKGYSRVMMYTKVLLLSWFICISFSISGQSVSVCSWNIKDFGRSKDDAEIAVIANTVKIFDVIAIQEVVAGYGGPQAVARLADELSRSGSKWDYAISPVTSGSSHQSERYAFIWNTAKLKKAGEPWLEQKFGLLIEREPFYGRFEIAGKQFTLVSFHALPKSKQPETEIKYLKFLPAMYPKDKLIFCGDFNLPQSHSVFLPLKKAGYLPALVRQKTSLRQKEVNGESLASELDNIFFKSQRLKPGRAGVVHFYRYFSNLKEASRISDHVPVYFEFSLL